MIILNANEVIGHQTAPPYERILKVLISPHLQDNVKNIGLGMVLIPPNCCSSSHIHFNEEETWYILSGRGEINVADQSMQVKKDTLIFIPPGESHQLINTGEETMKILWIYTPPGAELSVINKEHI